MATGNSLLLQTPEHTFADATARSGAAHAGWNWSAVAADLDDDSWPDIYATNGMWGDGRDHDRELEFWWETLAYWDDYVAGKKTFDRKGAGIAGIERDRFFRNRAARGRKGAAPIFEERSFLEGLDLETNGRAVVAFDANGDGALDLYVRSVEAPEALFLGSRRAGRALPPRSGSRGTPGSDNRDGVGCRAHRDAARRPPARPRDRQRERLPLDGKPDRAPRPRRRDAGSMTSTIRWPSGYVQELGPVSAVDRTIVVDEGQRNAERAARRPSFGVLDYGTWNPLPHPRRPLRPTTSSSSAARSRARRRRSS